MSVVDLQLSHGFYVCSCIGRGKANAGHFIAMRGEKKSSKAEQKYKTSKKNVIKHHLKGFHFLPPAAFGSNIGATTTPPPPSLTPHPSGGQHGPASLSLWPEQKQTWLAYGARVSAAVP